MLNRGLGWGVRSQFLRVVLIVHIVAHANEFATIVAAGEKNHSNTQDLGSGDALQIGRVSLENEFVGADRDGADKKRVKFLVILRASKVKEIRKTS